MPEMQLTMMTTYHNYAHNNVHCECSGKDLALSPRFECGGCISGVLVIVTEQNFLSIEDTSAGELTLNCNGVRSDK